MGTHHWPSRKAGIDKVQLTLVDKCDMRIKIDQKEDTNLERKEEE